MHGTTLAPVREQDDATVLARQNPGDPTSRTILDAMLRDRGFDNLRDQGAYLNLGYSTLSRAYNGNPVSGKFVRRVRAAFPRVRYEQIFNDVPAIPTQRRTGAEQVAA